MLNIINRTKSVSCLALIALLSLLWSGCSDDQAVRLRYEAEQKFHRAEKSLRDYRYQPGEVEPAVVSAIADQYRDLMSFCITALDSVKLEKTPQQWRELTYLAFQSTNRLSQLYYSARQFDSAAVTISRLINTIQLESPQFRLARLNYARALQASGKWEEAVVIFDELIQKIDPPVSDSSTIIYEVFGLPSFKYEVTSIVYGPQNAQLELELALSYYQRLAKDYPGTNLAASAHANLLRLYESVGRWKEAIAELSILNNIGSDEKFDLQVRMADIYLNGQNKPDEAIRIYDEVGEKIKETDSLTYATVMYKKSLALISKKEYNSARNILINLKRDYPLFFASTPAAQLAMATSFELEKNLNRAETEYKLLVELYPESEQAMSTYLHMIGYLEKNGRTVETEHWKKEANAHFDDLISRRPSTLPAAKAKIYKAELMMRLEKYQEAVNMLVDLFQEYPESDAGRRAMIQAAKITRDKLGDKVRSQALLEELKASMALANQSYEI